MHICRIMGDMRDCDFLRNSAGGYKIAVWALGYERDRKSISILGVKES